MLSTQIPQPDPHEISQLNSRIDIDERDSEVDLFTSGIDDKNPIHNFSIRDYVFNTRGKALKTNWPFSLKKLHLCLTHGVTDVLPPFQPLETVRKRNQSLTKCAVENTINSDKISVLPIETPFLEPEAENWPESPVGNIQNLVKKSKLIVKLSNIAESQLNTSKFSETMASKVCPVCKTFSSSSNTTLNAHIDQCLSGVSTSKSTTNSKAIKHAIKPRKTRLMVDIYATAKHCTLEDLDRRNGRNLVSNLGFSNQELAACDEEKNKEEGAVYVDSSGKKICILSKLSDLPSISNAKDDCGTTKLAKSDNGRKIHSIKEKRHIFKKNKKCPPYGQRSCSSRFDHCAKVNDVQERSFSREEVYEEEDIVDQMKSDELGMIKKWVGSQRSGLKKKIHPGHENRHSNETIKNLRVKNSLSSHGDMFINRMHDSNSPIFSDENPLPPTTKRKRKHNLTCDSDGEGTEQPSLRKRSGLSSLESRDFHCKRNHLAPSKSNVKQSRKYVPSVQKRHTDPLYCSENRVVSSPAKKSDRSRMSRDRAFSSGGNELASPRKPSSDRAMSFVSKQFSSLRKSLVSVTHASLPKLKVKLRRKHLDFEKRRQHYTSGSDEKAVVSRSEIYRHDNPVEELGENAAQMKKASRVASTNRTLILKIHKKTRGFVESDIEEKITSSEDIEKNIDSSMGGNVSAGTSTVKEIEIQDEFISKRSDGETLVAFTKSLDSAFPVVAYPSDLVIPDTNEEQGTYFVDVDPILIPGPPGSFLPSPGRMSSEEFQGNSSLTTCRRQSSEEGDEFLDMGSSHSHVSARSESVSFLNLSEMHNFDGSRDSLMLPEMVQFKNRHEPCCCYRKEEGNYQNYQESQLLQGPSKSVANSVLVYAPAVASHNSDSTMFPTFGDSESFPSPSNSNPVLRLMGKNLMVVNSKDENLSPQTRPTQSNSPIAHHSFHNTFSGAIFDYMPAQNTGFSSPNSFKIPDNIRTQAHQSMKCHEYGRETDLDTWNVSTQLGCDSSHMNSFTCYQNGSGTVQNSSIQVPSSNGMKANSVQWNCT